MMKTKKYADKTHPKITSKQSKNFFFSTSDFRKCNLNANVSQFWILLIELLHQCHDMEAISLSLRVHLSLGCSDIWLPVIFIVVSGIIYSSWQNRFRFAGSSNSKIMATEADVGTFSSMRRSQALLAKKKTKKKSPLSLTAKDSVKFFSIYCILLTQTDRPFNPLTLELSLENRKYHTLFEQAQFLDHSHNRLGM